MSLREKWPDYSNHDFSAMKHKPLRILDLRDSPWVDGPGRTILQTASMVNSARCEIIVGAFYGDTHGEHAYISEAKKRGLTILPVLESSAFDRKISKQIIEAIRVHSIDILHTHDFRSDLFGLWCAKRTGIPVISTCHGWIANNTKGKIYTNIDKLALRYFNRIITVSEYMRKQLIGTGFISDKIEVVPNALVIEDYQVNKHDHAFRHELGINSDTLLIGNIGRLSEEKGQDIFLYAAHELLKKYDNLHFALIGIGSQEESLRALVSELGIQDRISFCGYRSDMLSIYNSLDLVVQSSYTEGMPNVILESLLMETPVVATDVGGTGEIVEHMKSGLLIKSAALDELVWAIEDFMNNSAKHKMMAIVGQTYVKNNFNHASRVNHITEIYEDLMADLERKR